MKLGLCAVENRVVPVLDAGRALIDLDRAFDGIPLSPIEILLSEDWRQRVEALGNEAGELPCVPRESVRWMSPVPEPQKIICVGLNYADHAKETGDETPKIPMIFNKFPTALAAHEEEIELPAAAAQVDYEAELVVVIGRGGREIKREDAMDAVLGYCCGNDVSARDWQFLPPAKQWLVGKTFDKFAPVGPLLVSRDEIPNLHDLRIAMRLNGETLQEASTRDLIFDIPFLIEWISRVCTLLPGDLIFTGTPPGVGMGRSPQIFLKDGDVCEVEIEGVGLLKNRFRRRFGEK
ncbi:MAG: fumarylacetoacetate hydrolase family protein [Planctomycetia bacterium]|nr:fumarylacetoacetate hydrolase family protein [Planctomycetia bacterium]